jgi:hypothetical protein
MEMIRLTGKQKKEHLEMCQLSGISLLLLNSNIITGTILQRTFLLIIAGMFFCFAQPYNIYYGDLHNHTKLSDGIRWPEDAFRQAKIGNADFLAVTDHSWYGDEDWERLGEAALSSTKATFCGIRGFEMSAGWGHMNVFNTQWYTDALPVKEFYDTLVKHKDAIAQWNHPDYYTKHSSQFALYSSEYDSVIHLLEIYNGKRDVSFEQEYRIALDMGWHVGPTANSDNHSATWITGYDYRTAILAPSLQRDSLLDALRKHRTYATMNRNLRVLFTINNNIMGSTIQDSSSLLMNVNVWDPDTMYIAERIARIIVFSNAGTVVAEETFAAYKVEWKYELNQPQLYKGTYYYVKVINSDGDHAITAPVWIEGKKNELEKHIQPLPLVRINRLIFDIQGRRVVYDNNGDTRLLQKISSGVYVYKERSRTNKEHKVLFMQDAESH